MERERDREISLPSKGNLLQGLKFSVLFFLLTRQTCVSISQGEKKKRGKGQVKFEPCVILDDLLWV